jgi:hypothetical protein
MAEDLAYWRGETCAVIRRDFWKGNRPPDPRWNMGRECTIFNQLARQYTPEEIHGAYSVMRRCLAGEIPSGPVDGRVFNVDGRRDRLSRCVAFWRRQQDRDAGSSDPVTQWINKVGFRGNA